MHDDAFALFGFGATSETKPLNDQNMKMPKILFLAILSSLLLHAWRAFADSPEIHFNGLQPPDLKIDMRKTLQA